MRPDQAEFLLQFLLPQLRSEAAITKKIMSTVPPDRGDYTPHAGSMSASNLIRHIAVTEIWFLDAAIHREFRDTETMPAEVKTCSDIAQWYETNFLARMTRLEVMSGEELTTPVDYIGLRNDPAVAYLNIAIRHSVHHRGQLSAYLRPMGAKVPAIYVESGDEPFPASPGSPNVGEVPPAF